MRILLVALIILFSTFAAPSFACGGVSTNCNLPDERYYRILMPEGHDGKTPIGALIFAHGLGGSADSIINNRNLIKMTSELGIALISLQTKSYDWNVKNSPRGRADRSSNEYDYLDDVRKDISKRFAVDRSKLVLAGMSVGGTFTWTMACTGRNRFAAYIPISGAYWKNPPVSCSAPPQNVIHIHGTSDPTVPLTGRNFSNSGHANIYDIHKVYAKIGRYRKINHATPIDLDCKQSRNPSNKILDFCLHDGGHAFEARHISYAWKRLRRLGIL